MTKFIKKWWAEIFMGVGAIFYLFNLTVNRDWHNLIMAVMLYAVIGVLDATVYIKDEINDFKQERINLLTEILYRTLKSREGIDG
ncbi:hypothetical protein G7084_01395 [Weissella coleopterorum]|uniref:Uncharacterized protein n=1 Tax=Weissella coleopterorum TaxID=2714949 RepID=A0A6G8AYR1_9LACO|nr:hypothetical protein [Weissella coleopterorum]QIL50092.1 hypothetical protein G7084_01395 [Weissella coleopterorum]